MNEARKHMSESVRLSEYELEIRCRMLQEHDDELRRAAYLKRLIGYGLEHMPIGWGKFK